jgi:hypothetical protein
MKSKIATAIFSLASVLGFAEEAPVNLLGNLPAFDLKISSTKPILKQSFGYLRMGIADPDAINSFQALPGIGFGYRYGVTQGAFDVSANYNSEGKRGPHDTFSYTAPKVSYLRYVSSDLAAQSFYYGGGLAWGAVKKGNPNDFQGFAASATVGYEMNRTQNWHSFIQLDVSQAAVAVSRGAMKIHNAWNPLAEASVGLGF